MRDLPFQAAIRCTVHVLAAVVKYFRSFECEFANTLRRMPNCREHNVHQKGEITIEQKIPGAGDTAK